MPGTLVAPWQRVWPRTPSQKPGTAPTLMFEARTRICPLAVPKKQYQRILNSTAKFHASKPTKCDTNPYRNRNANGGLIATCWLLLLYPYDLLHHRNNVEVVLMIKMCICVLLNSLWFRCYITIYNLWFITFLFCAVLCSSGRRSAPAWRAPSAARLPEHGSYDPSGSLPRRARTYNENLTMQRPPKICRENLQM